jgi:hypothetical protein
VQHRVVICPNWNGQPDQSEGLGYCISYSPATVSRSLVATALEPLFPSATMVMKTLRTVNGQWIVGPGDQRLTLHPCALHCVQDSDTVRLLIIQKSEARPILFLSNTYGKSVEKIRVCTSKIIGICRYKGNTDCEKQDKTYERRHECDTTKL